MLRLLCLTRKTALALSAMFALATAAHAAPGKTGGDSDPLEPMNRAVFAFNQGADKYVLRPVVVGYRTITTPGIRTHIGNVTDNLYEPVSAINSLLQGDVTQGVTSLWRFVINSTIGIAGINDVATEAGLEKRSEDFGQTLAVWGVNSGPYLVLPILGPSNLRDTGGVIADIYVNPLYYYVDDDAAIGLGVANGLVKRDRLSQTIDDINESSLDPYTTFRTMYEQHRRAQISNGADTSGYGSKTGDKK